MLYRHTLCKKGKGNKSHAVSLVKLDDGGKKGIKDTTSDKCFQPDLCKKIQVGDGVRNMRISRKGLR